MFSIKQYVIDMTSAERKELLNLINDIEKNTPTTEAPAVKAPVASKTKADPAPTVE